MLVNMCECVQSYQSNIYAKMKSGLFIGMTILIINVLHDSSLKALRTVKAYARLSIVKSNAFSRQTQNDFGINDVLRGFSNN